MSRPPKPYSIPKRVRLWVKRVDVFTIMNEDRLERSVIRLMRQAYKEGQNSQTAKHLQEIRHSYDAGLMAGRREKSNG